MARTNKYASLNFNDVYEKKILNTNTTNTNSPNNSSSSSSPNLNKTKISNSRIHGNMLVLSRPTPKPKPISLPSQSQPHHQNQQQTHRPVSPDPTRIESDSISLRPLGRTGSAIAVSHSPLSSPRDFSKPEKFVPPHLRPGYVCKEEKPAPEFYKQSPAAKSREFSGRPKSGGGGYERMRRGSGSDFVEMFRPGSGGGRPSSSG